MRYNIHSCWKRKWFQFREGGTQRNSKKNTVWYYYTKDNFFYINKRLCWIVFAVNSFTEVQCIFFMLYRKVWFTYIPLTNICSCVVQYDYDIHRQWLLFNMSYCIICSLRYFSKLNRIWGSTLCLLVLLYMKLILAYTFLLILYDLKYKGHIQIFTRI